MADGPSPNIGKEVLFENARLRVWDLTLAPGEASELHHHQHDYVFIYVTPSMLEVTVQGGSPSLRRYADGYVQFNVAGEKGLTHRIRNLGDERHRQLLVEFLGPSAAPHSLPPETNGRENPSADA